MSGDAKAATYICVAQKHAVVCHFNEGNVGKDDGKTVEGVDPKQQIRTAKDPDVFYPPPHT